jgi:hypothetical protein
MTRSAFALTLALASTAGCAALPEAPDDLNSLNSYLFSTFDDANPDVPGVGLENLAALLEATTDRDFSTDSWRDHAWEEIAALAEADWGTADMWPDADPDEQIGVTVAVHSAFAPADHGSLVELADQTPIESSSSAVYDRTFTTAIACFLDQSCDSVDTENAIERRNPLLEVDYDAPKQFRWVTLPESDETALLSRSWLRASFTGNGGNNVMKQFTSIETYLPRDGGSWAFLTLWAYVDFDPEVAENIQRGSAGSGIQESFENSEAYLEAN